MYTLTTDAYFDSAHFLPDYFGKCENIHGHRWKVSVEIYAEKLEQGGSEDSMVMDFSKFKRIVNEQVKVFDHMFLVTENTLPNNIMNKLTELGFEFLVLPYRTTAENLAHDFYQRFKSVELPVKSVEVCETPTNRAKYEL